jgi:hypothetical protein
MRERRRSRNAEKLLRGRSIVRRLWYHWAFEIGGWRYHIRKEEGRQAVFHYDLIDKSKDEKPCYRETIGITHLSHDQRNDVGMYEITDFSPQTGLDDREF